MSLGSGSVLPESERTEEERQAIGDATEKRAKLKQELLSCRRGIRDLQKAAKNAGDPEKTTDRLKQLRNQLDQLKLKSLANERLLRQLRRPKTVRHGFVWLFLGKRRPSSSNHP